MGQGRARRQNKTGGGWGVGGRRRAKNRSHRNEKSFRQRQKEKESRTKGRKEETQGRKRGECARGSSRCMQGAPGRMRVSFRDAQLSRPRGCLLPSALCHAESQHENPRLHSVGRKGHRRPARLHLAALSRASPPACDARRLCPLVVGEAVNGEAG